MRSTPWTHAIPAVAHYELRDSDERVLGRTESHGEATRMLQAYVLTSPGAEAGVWLVSVGTDGSDVVREDVFDVEVASL